MSGVQYVLGHSAVLVEAWGISCSGHHAGSVVVKTFRLGAEVGFGLSPGKGFLIWGEPQNNFAQLPSHPALNLNLELP